MLKIVCPRRAARTVVDVPQTVEQLVEAPTIMSLVEVIRQPVEQPVDIPVRGWSGTGGRLQGFLPGQYSSSSVEQNVDIPVPRRGGRDRVGGWSSRFTPRTEFNSVWWSRAFSCSDCRADR